MYIYWHFAGGDLGFGERGRKHRRRTPKARSHGGGFGGTSPWKYWNWEEFRGHFPASEAYILLSEIWRFFLINKRSLKKGVGNIGLRPIVGCKRRRRGATVRVQGPPPKIFKLGRNLRPFPSIWGLYFAFRNPVIFLNRNKYRPKTNDRSLGAHFSHNFYFNFGALASCPQPSVCYPRACRCHFSESWLIYIL